MKFLIFFVELTVTRQRRGCDLNPGPTAPESSTPTTRLLSHPKNGSGGFFAECSVSQSTIDDVEALRKRHEDFAKALHGQDERMKALDDLADKLIRNGHPDAALYVWYTLCAKTLCSLE